MASAGRLALDRRAPAAIVGGTGIVRVAGAAVVVGVDPLAALLTALALERAILAAGAALARTRLARASLCGAGLARTALPSAGLSGALAALLTLGRAAGLLALAALRARLLAARLLTLALSAGLLTAGLATVLTVGVVALIVHVVLTHLGFSRSDYP